MHERFQATISRVFGWGLIAATLLVTPAWSLDPINPIKMLAVVSAGFVCLGLVIVSYKSINWREYRLVLAGALGFLMWQLFVVTFSGGQFWQQIFGTNGRNTGFLTYLSFILIFVGAILGSGSELLKRLLQVTFVVGIASVIYGLIQNAGADPFKWVNSYSAVFGFLGNPNFQSSLLGVLGSIVCAQLLSKGLKVQYKVLIVIYLLISIFVIKATISQQGFLVLAFGCAVVLGLYIYRRSKLLTISYAVASVFSVILIILGTLQKGPLSSILYQQSVTYRGDYWRAGWNMTLSHPIFGVGMDSYGDWYRRSRTLAATLRRGPDVTSNAAHNVFLDISSYGGFPLLIIYIALMALVVISAIKVIRRSTKFDPAFSGLFAGWVAFQSQSIISINQIGLAIWGWILSGAIIGFEINTRNHFVKSVEIKKDKKLNRKVQSSPTAVVAMFIAFVLGTLLGLPPYLASAKYKSALETSNPTIIQNAAYIWPLDFSRMIQVASTLDQNNLHAEGLKVALDATKNFPDNYSVWATLNAMSAATSEQKAQSLAQMKRLDPLNPNLK